MMRMQVKTVPSFDAKLSDICIGTSAAPTYLPPYYFENDGTEFNLVDGGVAACNPVIIMICLYIYIYIPTSCCIYIGLRFFN